MRKCNVDSVACQEKYIAIACKQRRVSVLVVQIVGPTQVPTDLSCHILQVGVIWCSKTTESVWITNWCHIT